jgi:hypothetical protein
LPAPLEHPLSCHPGSPGAAPCAIAVSAARSDSGGLLLSYRLRGQPGAIRLPAPLAPGAADGLWQHTCCEAFIAQADTPAYLEFNFSPTGQWAIYRFSDYRIRDASFLPPKPPQINYRALPDGFQLEATLAPDLLPACPWQIGLTAVIESQDGSKSYWALTHCGPAPDFHLRSSFTLNINTP